VGQVVEPAIQSVVVGFHESGERRTVALLGTADQTMLLREEPVGVSGRRQSCYPLPASVHRQRPRHKYNTPTCGFVGAAFPEPLPPAPSPKRRGGEKQR